jgi:hypothetical protein
MNTKTNSVNNLLEKLRDFLHTEDPTEREREIIYGELRRHPQHKALWLPLFEAHARWSQEPLVWCHIRGMNGGSLPSDVYGPWSMDLEEYDALFPKAPIKLLLRGGHPNVSPEGAPTALLRRCVHVCIDHPEWSVDAGQDGQYSGSANILEILDGAQSCLKGHLRALHTFTFEAAPHSRYSSTDEDVREHYVQTTLEPRTFSRRDGGFDRLKKLLAGRAQLRRLTLSNKAPLSEHHPRTGRARPYCGWLPRCAWWPRLESLDLHQNRLRDADLGWLFAAPMPALTRLVLRENKLGDGAVEALSQGGAFPALEHLDLRQNELSPQAAQALRQRLPHLKTLLV